ncbi:unnamed protein product [Danaus chrysippus]|uniref:(African queen) hypothetical protein n=1 Tax=Danaus chrysippus TaxID=151541 RepID=A0A8J2R2M4_9NEOP|nr:unnamed protein product [Danaus chrysippus]
MEGGLRRAAVNLFLLAIVYVSNITCQNVQLEAESRGSQLAQNIDLSRDQSPKAQLMNTLISIANGKKERTPASQMNTIQDTQPAAVMPNQRSNTLNVMSVSPPTSTVPKETIAVNPMLTTTSLPQPVISNSMMMPASFPSSYPSPYIKSYQPVVLPLPTSYSARPPQVIPLENYANMVQSYPASYQIQQPASVPSVVYAEPISPMNLEINPSGSLKVLPTINTDPSNYDIISGSYNTQNPEPVVMMSDREGLPFNVQINVPPQNTATPRITLISAAPTNPPSNPNPVSSNTYPPPMPIIMRNSRSSWKNILPIILIALFNDRDGNSNCCCPCNCGCNSDSPTPIPYPIPIPEEVSSQVLYPGYGGVPVAYDNNDDDDLGLLLTVLLLATRNKNNDNCNCCSCCNCGSSKSIPVPYPIPFPTNNPVINNQAYRDSYDDYGDEVQSTKSNSTEKNTTRTDTTYTYTPVAVPIKDDDQ